MDNHVEQKALEKLRALLKSEGIEFTYKQATRNIDGFLSAKNAIEDIVLDLTGSYEV